MRSILLEFDWQHFSQKSVARKKSVNRYPYFNCDAAFNCWKWTKFPTQWNFAFTFRIFIPLNPCARPSDPVARRVFPGRMHCECELRHKQWICGHRCHSLLHISLLFRQQIYIASIYYRYALSKMASNIIHIKIKIYLSTLRRLFFSSPLSVVSSLICRMSAILISSMWGAMCQANQRRKNNTT